MRWCVGEVKWLYELSGGGVVDGIEPDGGSCWRNTERMEGMARDQKRRSSRHGTTSGISRRRYRQIRATRNGGLHCPLV